MQLSYKKTREQLTQLSLLASLLFVLGHVPTCLPVNSELVEVKEDTM